MVRRERNHPSVILWSIGNEICRAERTRTGPRRCGDIVHAEDPPRPVTAGCNNPQPAPTDSRPPWMSSGLNYHTGDFRADAGSSRERKQTDVLLGVFVVHQLARRVLLPGQARPRTREVNFQVSSYDVDHPGWAQSPDEEFAALDHSPAFLGEFVWTGFDYLGEPTPYNSDVTNLLNFSDPDRAPR